MSNTIETFEFHDMDQYMELAAETMDVLSIQLQPGRLYMLNQVLQLDDMTVTHYASNRQMFQYLTIPPEHVLFVLTPASVSGCQWCGIEVSVNSLAILHPDVEHQALIPTNWNSIEFLISDATIIKEALFSESQWQRTFQPQHALFTRQASRIRSFHKNMQQLFQAPKKIFDLSNDNSAKTLLNNQIIDTLRRILMETEIDRLQHSPRTRSRRYKTLSRALAFIETNLEHQLTIQHICEQIGSTPRTLQLTFQELTGVSPYQYILSRKLHAIQQGMFNSQDATMHVFEQAQNFGMHHAGRFSQQYKRMFTESPQAAMKRRIRQ